MFASLLSHINKSCCILCNTNTPKSLSLCTNCLFDLPIILNSCPTCGKIVSTQSSVPCGSCQKNKPYVDRTFSLFQYKTPVDYFIKQVKFHNSLMIADLLGMLMVDHIIDNKLEKPEAIIPIPLHFKRLRQRGYNQALEIAKPLSKQLNIPILSHHLIRNKHTQPQTDCSIKERKKNITNSFTVTAPLPFKTIAIIDDVITTGSTINEAAKVLKQHSVEQVFAWSCANTNLLR